MCNSLPDRLVLIELASFFFREHAFLDEQLNELIGGSHVVMTPLFSVSVAADIHYPAG